MDRVLIDMISHYQCRTSEDYKNALKEIIQDISLLGLWRAKFFEHAAFYGGTALRILYGLDRFSEDLDFTLLKPHTGFNFKRYLVALESELASFGLSAEATEKSKSQKSAIRSAFLKANTAEHLLRIEGPRQVMRSFQLEERLKVKLEIDTDPCEGYVLETRDLLQPVPFWVRTLTLPTLFAGKLHAVLCREWGKRVKGRDWYDLLWFVQRRTPLHLEYLTQKMRQTGHLLGEALDQPGFLTLLHRRIDHLDIERAKEDVIRFVRNPKTIDGWSRGTFHAAAEQIIYESAH